MSVGEDQRPLGRRADRRRRRRVSLNRIQTFALGVVVGTFLVGPLASRTVSAVRDARPPDGSPEERSPPAPPFESAPPSGNDLDGEPPEAEDDPSVIAALEAVDTATVVATPEVEIFAGVVQPNQFVAEILGDSGVPAAEVDRALLALKGTYDFRRSQPGHTFQVEVDPVEGRLLRFEYRAAPDEVYEVVRADRERFLGRRTEVQLERAVVAVDGVVEGSLWEAVVEAGESSQLAFDFAEVFQYDVDFFHDTRAGDRFRFFVEKLSVDGEMVRYGRIKAAEYVGVRSGPVGTRRLYFWDGGRRRSRGYYDADGKAARRAFLRSPLKYTRVSSPYGYRRHPILGRRHFHGGVDYAAPTGTPVRAVADGRVVWAGPKGPAGKMVRIRHSDGYESFYLHLSVINVRRNQRVSQSTVIGRVGSTGRSTGPHLDFRLKRHGNYLDPRRHVAPRTRSVPRAEHTAFRAAIRPWVQRMAVALGGEPKADAR